MKYKVGDKVMIKNIEWYNQMLSIPDKVVWQNKLSNDLVGVWCGSQIFYEDMCQYCGEVLTIQDIKEGYYVVEEDTNILYKFTDEMIEHLVAAKGEGYRSYALGQKSHVIPSSEFYKNAIEEKTPKFNYNDTVETNDGLRGYIDEIKYDNVRNTFQYYVSFIVDGGYYYETQLKLYVKKKSESIEPKFKVGDVIVKKDGLTNSYLVTSVGSDYYGLSFCLPNSDGVGVLAVKEQDEWELLSDRDMENYEFMKSEIVEKPKPSLIDFMDMLNNEISLPNGYEFKDGDGNLIEVDKIVLAKKSVRYPKSYKECFDIMCPGEPLVQPTGYWHKWGLLAEFSKLLLCRDAYWQIAGKKMGLGKPWGPDWTNLDQLKYCIWVDVGEFVTMTNVRGQHTLAFPTEEMRDAFYEAFKELIEKCKELL